MKTVSVVACLIATTWAAACKSDVASRTLTEPGDAVAAQATTADGRLSASQSSVCLGYQEERATARALLVRKPVDMQLKQTVATYNVLIADACE